MDYLKMLQTNPFSLVAALPANRLDFAEGALKGGAQAIKVHCNVWHRASGNTFGSFAENRQFLKDLIALCGDVPVGLVPGTEECFVTEEEKAELEEMGLSFFSAYCFNTPCYMMHGKLRSMVALGSEYSAGILSAVDRSSIDVVEASIQPGENYGKPLNVADLLKYSEITHAIHQPVVVPTQKNIRPAEVADLAESGCKAIMIGAIVYGPEPDADRICRVTAQFAQQVLSISHS